MKIFITAILIALLTACGSCGTDDTKVSEVTTPVQAQQPIVEPSTQGANPTVAPSPVKCSDVVTENCYVEFCPFSTGDTTNCPPSPTPAPVRVVNTDPAPVEPVCVRDTTPLIFVDPFWVDNCGNKYGQVTV